MNRRDGKGSFKLSDQALDSFGRAPQEITDAYIVWALTSVGETGLDAEIDQLVKLAETHEKYQKDSYFIGLVTAILYNVDKKVDAKKFGTKLISFQNETGSLDGAQTSITSSRGKYLITEATSIAVIAWLNDASAFSTNIEKGIGYIIGSVEDSSYGSTQATILALKAITSYMKNAVTINGSGSFAVMVNNEEAMEFQFDSSMKGTIDFDLRQFVKDNSNTHFAPNKKPKITLKLKNFTPDVPNSEDFKVSASINVAFHDTLPEVSTGAIGMTVTPSYSSLNNVQVN